MLFGVKSDKGMAREINEDSFNLITGCPDIPDTFIIADGMGGHNSGEVASKIAVDTVCRYIMDASRKLGEENYKIKDEVLIGLIRNAIIKANAEILNKSKENEEFQGMGTTIIASMIYEGKLFIGHVGDSRVYVIRDRAIEKITTDHSYIEELIRNGSLRREEAERHPKRNLITRALGCWEDLLVDTYTYCLSQGDHIVMCTDGLTNMLSEDEIMAMVLKSPGPENASEVLVDTANAKGGYDNITVIIIRND